ncbi:MAG: mevalonate kinase [Thermoanaerobaculia bacterium]
MNIRVSASGKSILMGEHAAVYGRPALVAAVDRRLTVEMSARDDSTVVLELPGVGVSTVVEWGEIDDYTLRARGRWEAYDRDPGPEAFRRLRGDDPAHLVKVALGEAAGFLGEKDGRGLELRLESEIPVGAGFGSSAAAAVAVVRGLVALRGRRIAADELHRVTLDVERRQHGRPSGIDNATVILGGLVWAERDADDRLTTSPLAPGSPVLENVEIFNTGEPAESTGDVVAAVRERVRAEPERYEALLDRMEAATRELRRALESADDPARRVVGLMREFEACLEALGVVPEPVRQIVREIEKRGGAAKISGAGALSGDGAGSVLVYHPRTELRASELPRTWKRLDLRLGAAGVREESREGAEGGPGEA